MVQQRQHGCTRQLACKQNTANWPVCKLPCVCSAVCADSVKYFLAGATVLYTATFANGGTENVTYANLVVTAGGSSATLTCPEVVTTASFLVPAGDSVACNFTIDISSSDITAGSLDGLAVSAAADGVVTIPATPLARADIKLYAPKLEVSFTNSTCGAAPTMPGEQLPCLAPRSCLTMACYNTLT